MSSKSSSSSRQSSPRAMPVETIITRFKSAQQKRQLRDMDRSMTKVTELLKNPLKPKIKKKVPLKKSQRSSSVQSLKDAEEQKGNKKNKVKTTEKVNNVEEHCPLNLKRHIVLNKVRLIPKHELKVIAQTNKRKRSVPKKGLHPEDNNCQMPAYNDCASRDGSPKAKRSILSQDRTTDDMIQLIEETESLNDEDLLEILTCPSPVWWEDPPDGYIEDALFSRPRSSAEMYPSIRTQLQENLQEKKRSNTPNVLLRNNRVNSQRVSSTIKTQKTEKEELLGDDNIDLQVALTNCDEKFIKKRNKLESVLGNLKHKNFRNNDLLNKKEKQVEVIDIDCDMDRISNKVSGIKNLRLKKVTNANDDVQLIKDFNNLERNNDADEPISLCTETDSESTDDDDRLTDISFQDDTFLNDLENMDIPMQQNADPSPKKHLSEVKKVDSVNLFPDKNEVKDGIIAVVHLEKQVDDIYARSDCCTINDCFRNKKSSVNCKESSVDPTYSDKQSSIIEDYLEMKLFEDVGNVVNKKNNECPKTQLGIVKPLKFTKDCKQIETNVTTSVIKFKNSDDTSINVFKIGVVPNNLPPLKTSDKRKNNAGRVPEILPPLRPNPVIQVNPESPKSNKSTTSYETSESYSSELTQDNIDSISDTNICFLNEDDEDFSTDKNMNIEDIIPIKSGQETGTHELNSCNVVNTSNDKFLKKESKCSDNKHCKTNELHFIHDVDLYNNLTQMSCVIDNTLEYQSLTITKVNDNNCCKLEHNKDDTVIVNKHDCNLSTSDVIRKQECTKSDNSTESATSFKSEFSPLIDDKIGKIGNENADCITVYKIVSDDSGNEDHKNDLLHNIRSPNVEEEFDVDQTLCSSKGKSESNRDKINFYFKKCKNLCWNHKTEDKSKDQQGIAIEHNEILENKHNCDTVDDKSENIITEVSTLEGNKEVSSQNYTKESNNDMNYNNNIIASTDTNEQKCIIISNTKQIKYCMKCSSIFDTATCNYCFKNDSAEKKSQCAIDNALEMEQCFICDVCSYKALSKRSLKQHILRQCYYSHPR